MIFTPDLLARRAWAAPAPVGYCEDGWAGVISDLFDAFDVIAAATPGLTLDVVAMAERDGRLVCDVVPDPPDPTSARAVGAAVAAASARAEKTCATCGRAGRLRLDRPAWPVTRCDEHAPRAWPA